MSSTEHRTEPPATGRNDDEADAHGRPPGPPPPAPSRRLRRVAAVVLVVLTSIATLAAGLAVWADRTLFQSDRFANLVGEVTDDPAVIHAISERLVDQVAIVLEEKGLVADVLPPNLQRLTPLVTSGLSAAAEQQVESLLATERAQDVIVAMVRRAHQAAMRLLNGDGLTGDGLTVSDGVVTLNLLPLVDDVLRGLQQRGIIPADLDIPELSAEGEPSEQLDQLATRFGVTLPPDFGQVTVYESQSVANAEAAVARAQNAVVLFKRALVALVLAVFLLAALALVVSTNRWRTLAQIGLGTALAMIVAAVAVNRVVADLPGTIVDPEGRAAASAILDSLTASLHRLTWALIIGGVVVALLGFLFGRSPAATRLRSRAGTPDRGAAPARSGLGGTLAGHADAVRVGVLGLAALVLLVAGISWASVLVAAVIVAGGLGGVELARRTPSGAPA